MKRFLTLLIALSVLLTLPLTAFAHDVPQDRTDCTIQVIVRYDGKDITGGTLTAIKVGFVDEDDGNYFFSQEKTGTKIADVTSASAAETQKAFYDANKASYTFAAQTQKVSGGKASFSGLSTGLYLMVQEEAAYGYSKLKPFLVSVPYMKDGKYQYNVTATVKSELEREPQPTEAPPPPPSDDKAPQTGQLNWPVPLMAAAGLALLAAGWVLRFGKKKESYEK